MAYYGQANPQVQAMFAAVDKDRSGQITAKELQAALINSDWTQFNVETCRLMISMFDRDNSGTINVMEFEQLYSYIEEWRKCFQSFDRDGSGKISANELSQALQSFGLYNRLYRLSPRFSDLVVRKFDRVGKSSMEFDAFIQACIMLKCLTDSFREKDVNQTGVIQINYEEFLELVFSNAIH